MKTSAAVKALKKKINEAKLPPAPTRIVDDAVYRRFMIVIGKKKKEQKVALILTFAEIKLLPNGLQRYFQTYSPKREQIAHRACSKILNLTTSSIPQSESGTNYIISELTYWAQRSDEKQWFGLKRGKEIITVLSSYSGPVDKDTFYHNDVPIEEDDRDVVVELKLVVKKVIK